MLFGSSPLGGTASSRSFQCCLAPLWFVSPTPAVAAFLPDLVAAFARRAVRSRRAVCSGAACAAPLPRPLVPRLPLPLALELGSASSAVAAAASSFACAVAPDGRAACPRRVAGSLTARAVPPSRFCASRPSRARVRVARVVAPRPRRSSAAVVHSLLRCATARAALEDTTAILRISWGLGGLEGTRALFA